jgi:sulfate transporter 4
MPAMEWLELLLPCTRWIRTYKWREYLQADIMAGVTVGTMLVPQAMSYAKLAGLHPIYGLYSGFVPVFAYAIFGSSRQLAIGPVALVSLLVSNTLSSIVDSTDELYTELAILLALLVGILECVMGILRLGWLIRFISHSVISGFTTSSAIVIALSQAKYFLGYSITRSSKIIPLVKSIVAGADKFSWPPFVMGSIMLAILLTMKQLGKKRKKLRFLRVAGPLTAVILGTVYVKIFHPQSISVVGGIPEGLPSFSVPKCFDYVKRLIPTALLITGVAILESVGIAKALAAKNGYELDSNQELFGLGVANICGSFFSAYPTTGSFSRSAVNHESGAKTGLSGFIMGVIILCALQFLTPLFTDIPQCTLAAIVVSAVMGLIDYEEAIFLWRVDKRDFLLWVATSITTLFLGIEIGVLVGVGASLAFVIHESANPHIAVLGRLPGTTVYRNIKQYSEAYTYKGIVVVRIDAPIYFANISYIKERLQKYEVGFNGTTNSGIEGNKMFYVVIEMAPVTYIDSSAAQALKELYQEYKARNIQMALSNPNREVLSTLAMSGVLELVGKQWYFVRVHDAVQVCLSHMQGNLETLNTGGEEPKQDTVRKRGNTSLSNFFLGKKDAEELDTERQPLIIDIPED